MSIVKKAKNNVTSNLDSNTVFVDFLVWFDKNTESETNPNNNLMMRRAGLSKRIGSNYF